MSVSRTTRFFQLLATRVGDIWSADLRSLAVFRAILALLALADIVERAGDLTAHYTDRGVMPRTLLLTRFPNQSPFSIQLVSGDPLIQALLFTLAALAALSLLVGWRTRLMTFLVWVFLVSLHERNPLVINAGDILLRLLFFWSIFLPLGARWSLDRRRSSTAPLPSNRFVSVATVGLFLQIAYVYWFGVLLKTGSDWRVEYSAIYYTLSLDQYVTPFGKFLHPFPALLAGLTFAVFWYEAIGPFLLFSPVFNGPLRTAAILGFIGLHLGIALTMSLGLFSWTATLTMLCFLPGWFWDKLAGYRALHGLRQKLQPRTRLLSWLSTPLAPFRQRWSLTLAAQEPQPLDGAVRRMQLLTNLLATFFVIYILCWNISTVSAFRIAQPFLTVGSYLRLDQRWDMFAPFPLRDDGWFVIPGTFGNGKQVDLLPLIHNDFSLAEGIDWNKPPSVAQTLKNEHWRKYLGALWLKQYADQRAYFGQYLCRTWNARYHEAERMQRLEMYFMLERTLPNYQPPKVEKVLLMQHTCS